MNEEKNSEEPKALPVQITALPPQPSCQADYSDYLGRNIEELILQRLGAPNDSEARTATRNYLRTMENEFLRSGSSPMEVMLARRVVVCYLTVHYFETLYLESMQTSRPPYEHAVELLRLNQANERYLASLRAFTGVRRMRLTQCMDNIFKRSFPSEQK